MKPETEQPPAGTANEASASTAAPSHQGARLRPALLRLVFVTALFLGWIGYLAYLVWTLPPAGPSQRPPLLSHPQILVSAVDIVGTIESPRQPVRVEEVLHAGAQEAEKLPGSTIQVINLEECRQAVLGPDGQPQYDYTGPGRYLLPLRPLPDGSYEVVRIPPSPGYPYNGPPRIYPATPDILGQYRQASKAPQASP